MSIDQRIGFGRTIRVVRRVAGPVILLAAAALALAPQWKYGYSCGHDFDFHLVSWFEALTSWRHGLLYPHWAVSPNYSAGEPRFVFYPPITWMLGAALHLLTGWGYVPIVLAYLMLAGTGLATRALARELLNDGAATLAGCVAIFSGYALFTAYERSAFGELTGGFWIPLLLLFVLRDRNPAGRPFKRALDGSALPLAFVVGGIWLSNVPLGVIACYLLAAVAVALALIRRSWAPAIRAALGATLGLGLACFFLIPAIWEQKWVDITQAINDPATRIESSWLFARHADPNLELHDTVLLRISIIAASMMAVLFACAAIVWLRHQRRNREQSQVRAETRDPMPGHVNARREWWILLAAIPAAILLLQFPASEFVWNALPKLRFLQFPWRWMVAVEAPMGIFFAAALWPVRLRWRVCVSCVCAVLFAGATLIALRFFLTGCEPEDSISAMLVTYAAGMGFDGDDEYEPPNADDSLVPTGLPGACLVDDPKAELATPSPDTNPTWDAEQKTCAATFPTRWAQAENLRMKAQMPQAGYLVLRLRTYPAWRVTVNGTTTQQFDKRDDGLMAIAVPKGSVDVDIRWINTGDAIAGRWLSGITLLLVAMLGWVEFTRLPRQM